MPHWVGPSQPIPHPHSDPVCGRRPRLLRVLGAPAHPRPFGPPVANSPEPLAGFPNSLQTRDQMCHFVTMCIFTCTGQHSSTHLGQVLTMGAAGNLHPQWRPGLGAAALRAFHASQALTRDICPSLAGLVLLGP